MAPGGGGGRRPSAPDTASFTVAGGSGLPLTLVTLWTPGAVSEITTTKTIVMAFENVRAQYGSPHSNGCVEPTATAVQIWPLTPIGTWCRSSGRRSPDRPFPPADAGRPAGLRWRSAGGAGRRSGQPAGIGGGALQM
ncbi:MAG: hypothetical protein ACYCU7_15165 [Acidimicrobiales bacterium]